MADKKYTKGAYFDVGAFHLRLFSDYDSERANEAYWGLVKIVNDSCINEKLDQHSPEQFFQVGERAKGAPGQHEWHKFGGLYKGMDGLYCTVWMYQDEKDAIIEGWAQGDSPSFQSVTGLERIKHYIKKRCSDYDYSVVKELEHLPY